VVLPAQISIIPQDRKCLAYPPDIGLFDIFSAQLLLALGTTAFNQARHNLDLAYKAAPTIPA
jgi:hypothetical protein